MLLTMTHPIDDTTEFSIPEPKKRSGKHSSRWSREAAAAEKRDTEKEFNRRVTKGKGG